MFHDAKPSEIHAAHMALTGRPAAAQHNCARLIQDLAKTYGRRRLGSALKAAATPATAHPLAGMALA